MASLTFKYRSGSSTYSRTFSVLRVRGLEHPDTVEFVPGLQWTAPDGTIIESIVGFRRLVSVEIGVLNDATDRTFIFNFMQHTQRWITLTTYASVYCSLVDPSGFQNDWLEGSSLRRQYTVNLKENSIYTDWPEFLEPVETETLYISDWIAITGTEASPQTLTTNAGALATDAAGNAFPAINLAAYTVSILITERQSTLVHQIGAVTQSGTDISFTVAAAGGGNAYLDGNVYAKFTIGLQAIP